MTKRMRKPIGNPPKRRVPFYNKNKKNIKKKLTGRGAWKGNIKKATNKVKHGGIKKNSRPTKSKSKRHVKKSSKPIKKRIKTISKPIRQKRKPKRLDKKRKKKSSKVNPKRARKRSRIKSRNVRKGKIKPSVEVEEIPVIKGTVRLARS